MMQSLITFIFIRFLSLSFPVVSSCRIEKGSTLSSASVLSSSSSSSPPDDANNEPSWHQERRRTPPNTADPDYFHPTSRGGRSHHPGNDGSVVFVAHVHIATHPTRFETIDVPPLELRARYFAKNNVVQTYVVPGDKYRRPYGQEVRVKIWGGGGGGCDGGRGETKLPLPEKDQEQGSILKFSEGSGGGYVEAVFHLPVGDVLQIVVGGGGMSGGGSLPDSLGGKGGYNGGHPGRSDDWSGGGGGGGLTTVTRNNGTVILAAAYGGDGGGNTTYCTASGGVGASLRGLRSADDAGGYINFDALPTKTATTREEMPPCPGEPAITTLSHDSAAFTWNAGSHRNERSKELYVQRYTVQLSEQDGNSLVDDEDPTKGLVPPCAGEFELHEHIQRDYDITQNATTEVTKLRASTNYCIRIEAFSIEGLSLGVEVFPFVTNAVPVNRWLPVTLRESRVSTVSEFVAAKAVATNEDNEHEPGDSATISTSTSSSWCQHSSGRPTGRRGHSMTIVNDQVYIFGGATLKCVCELHDNNGPLQGEGGKQRSCTSENVYSNELWHFAPLTAMFTQLQRMGPEEPWPRGREQHSATALPNGDIIVIGGISTERGSSENDDDDLKITGEKSASSLLADVWRMRDPHHISSHVFYGINTSSNGMSLPLELISGHIRSHKLSISLNDKEGGEMCIHAIQAKLSLDLHCLKGIEYIKLTGPGLDVAHETKIFVGSMDNPEAECQHSSLHLLFSDNVEESVLSYASIPTSGSFRPASSLMSTFGGLPIDGEWTLSIALSKPIHPEVDHHDHVSYLLNWELEVDVKPCVARAKWEKLQPKMSSSSPTSIFSPRRLHTTVAVDDSIFVAGGFAERRLSDLWRFDYDSNTWTELNNHAATMSRVGSKTWPMNGQAASLGPSGLLAFGGIAKYGHLEQGHDLWHLDFFGNEDWVPVPIPQNASAHDGGSDIHGIPYRRYLSTIGYFDTIYKSHGVVDGKRGQPMALVFGGDGGHLYHTYADSYGFVPNSFFNDVWLLSPGGIGLSTQHRQEGYCDWRFLESSTAFQSWNNTCGWDAYSMDGLPGECGLERILIAAWCKKQYQSLWMS